MSCSKTSLVFKHKQKNFVIYLVASNQKCVSCRPCYDQQHECLLCALVPFDSDEDTAMSKCKFCLLAPLKAATSSGCSSLFPFKMFDVLTNTFSKTFAKIYTVLFVLFFLKVEHTFSTHILK